MKQKGFGLIGLIITIGIIAFLAVLALKQYMPSKQVPAGGNSTIDATIDSQNNINSINSSSAPSIRQKAGESIQDSNQKLLQEQQQAQDLMK